MHAPQLFRSHLLPAGVFILLLASWASAYTVVLRGGKRIQIPAEFFVTRTVLSYEVSPGMNITLQLASIDIAETERVNNEPAGSFAQRIHESSASQSTNRPAKEVRAHSVRTITNGDLEAYKTARLESERAYEQIRRGAGFPSAEERRERIERESAAAQEFVQQRFLELQQESARQQRMDQLEREVQRIDRQAESDDDLNRQPDFYWPSSILFDGSSLRNRNSRFNFGFGFNRRFFPRRPRIFVAPGARHFDQGRFDRAPAPGIFRRR